MLTPTTRLRLQGILDRIAADEPVSLAERIYVQKFADRDASVASWLRQARRRQQGLVPLDGLDRLLADMNLGDWFGGAPGWLRRS
jgi:hypothetical protein